MRFFTKSALSCLLFLLASNCLNACELPAHPSATAMPVGITTKDGKTMTIKDAQSKGIVSLIQGNNDGQFHYLIPEGSKVQLKIVWDPVCHNNPADPNSDSFKRKVEEYEYIIDGHNEGGRIYPDEEIGTVGGYGFFPLSAMSKFFTLNGNRKDVKEAFTREKGIKNQDEVIEAGLGGPQLKLGMFAATGEKLEVSIVSGQESGYKDSPKVEATLKSEIMELEGINKMLPGEHWNLKVGDSGIYLYDSNSKKAKSDNSFMAYKVNNSDDELVVYSKSGLLMKDIDYGLEEPDPKKYIAYIVENNNKEKIHVSGINYDKINPDPNANGGSDGKFSVTFTTPSIAGCLSDGSEADAAIKIMVNSPPAGYKLSNIFWVWEEQDYKRIKKGEVEEEGSTTKLDCTANDVFVYEKSGKARKCSVGLVIVIDKPQDGVGYAAYKVYDNCGPISTMLTLNEDQEAVFSETDGKTDKDSLTSTFKYKIELLDSNPFIDKQIVAQKNGGNVIEKTPSGDISQNTDKMEVTFYYNYPVYNYVPKSINKIEDLKGCGLVDFPDGDESGREPKFKSYDHNISWYWKKASNVYVEPVVLVKKINGDDGRLIGSISSIQGTFTIDNPKPWHVNDNYPEINGNRNLSVFAVLKDPAGNTHLVDVYKTDQTNTPLESANPENFSSKEYAVNPTITSADELKGNSDKSSGLSPYWVDDLVVQGKNHNSNWKTDLWQPIKFMSAKDMTAPEIQVIVLDTRTNRYHVFGTKDNVAASLNNFTTTTHKGYNGVIDSVPYIGRNGAISDSYVYNKFDNINDLYDTYLNGSKAVSTVKEALNKNGFVCQKGSRLVFYPHAFDNIGYNDATKFYGIQPGKFTYTLVDYHGNEIEKDKAIDTSNSAIEYVFRQENYDKNGVQKAGYVPYKLIIKADDNANNHREFELDIAVMGRTLDIRTLEEKRERVD